MIIFSYALIIVLVLALIFAYIYLKKKSKDKERACSKFVNILLYSLIVVFFFRFMWGKDAIAGTFKLQSNFSSSAFVTGLSLVFNALVYANTLCLVLYPFFNIKNKNILVTFFVLPISIVSSILFYYLAIGIVGSDAFLKFNFRTLLMTIEFAISLSASLIISIKTIKNGFSRADLKILYYIPILLLSVFPPYMLQGLFGHLNYSVKIKNFSFPHRIILYLSFIIPIVIYFLFRKKDMAVKHAVLTYISIGTLLSFSVGYKFPDFLDITHWPFHLCNTAMYIVVVCLIFHWKKLFYFTYFINVLGALLAMLMPNYSSTANLFSSSIVVFYTNHYIAFFMPLLIVALGIYARPKLKEFIYSIVGFLIYFVLVLILNAWFSNYGSVDYFFVNSDFIAEKLGQWAENLRDLKWEFDIKDLHFVFYPIYQTLFFLVYVLLGAGVWFIYGGAYDFVDTIKDINERNQKIKLDTIALQIKNDAEKKGMNSDKASKGERKLAKSDIKLVLDNFSKRYGKSENYAVQDASLTINGGDIFGFLGHNGAGKSTIIKSIVGIQPITSGKINVCGYDVETEAIMAKKNIGYVPDHYALYEKLTGREYINYIADLYGVSKEDRDKAIDKYVELFELSESFDNQIKTYSHGMKQKIAIMSALVHNPKVWILDEPLTGLDPNSIYQVKKCMKEHAKKGNIVFFSSHLIDIVEQLCSRIAIIKKGKILTDEYVKDIESKCALEEYYLKVTNFKDIKK